MSVADLKYVARADVFKAGTAAATLSRSKAGCTFAYLDDYDGPAVATSLPVGAGPITTHAGAVPPFFAGLLPEGRRLSALRRAIKTSADDELSLLLAIGTDPVGDVQILPAGSPPTPPETIGPADLRTTRFADLFARVLAPEPADRVGLPGVQDKVSGRLVSLPLTWGERPSILKLNPPEFRHLVHNEAFFLTAARRCGLEVPDHRVVHDADGAPGLLVARFDRFGGGTPTERRAQEDGCQVLGLYPADKYLPSSEDVVAGLAARCGAPTVAARSFLRQLAFAYLTCNGDAHAKNLSILQDDRGEWRASPAYDLPSTHPYGDTTMALSLGGRTREDIGRAQFVALGAAVAVPKRAVDRVLDDLVGRIDSWLPEIHELPFAERTVHKLRKAIEWRRDRLAVG